ncbi:putative protein kinase CAMK-OST1L family [Rosa chinensis]|uniref:non-specific serine/threonine protein kinase n=1 Tax=Rosa chinensis TaxID=74649 RepID=A0A2P6PIL1_ROSCH|nr:putative protein kinase CAMK-OST1L family [Rosa chinensis]
MEKYEVVKDIGSGNFGVARLVRDKNTQELLAVKFIERGLKIDENVLREIMNHRSLKHPNIVQFKEVLLTPTHLAIVMEYAAGGELYDRIVKAVRFSENEARFFFQQLISGVSYCHTMSLLSSLPKSTVGTPAYIAPEVLSKKQYDGQVIADVWSCGVTLYVMLVGAYPFEDPKDLMNFRKTIRRILTVRYVIPDSVRISVECRHLLSKIFVANPEKKLRPTDHRWFAKNLPLEMKEGGTWENNAVNTPSQSIEEVQSIRKEARKPLKVPTVNRHCVGSSMAIDDADVEGT